MDANNTRNTHHGECNFLIVECKFEVTRRPGECEKYKIHTSKV